MAWHAREVLRWIYEIPDADATAEFVTQLGGDLQDECCPVEVRQLGRTILRRRRSAQLGATSLGSHPAEHPASQQTRMRSPEPSALQPPEVKHLAKLGKFLLREGSSLFDQVILLQAH